MQTLFFVKRDTDNMNTGPIATHIRIGQHNASQHIPQCIILESTGPISEW